MHSHCCRQHKVFNKGMPAWGSDNFEPCLESIMPQVGWLVAPQLSQCQRQRQCGGAPELCRRALALLSSDPPLLRPPMCVHAGRGPRSGRVRRERLCGSKREPREGELHPVSAWMERLCAAVLRQSPLCPADRSCTVVLLCLQYSYASRVRRVYEQVLRRLLLSPSKPAVVLLQMFPWWRSPGDGVPDGLYYREPETEMTVLGQVTHGRTRLLALVSALLATILAQWRCHLSFAPFRCRL